MRTLVAAAEPPDDRSPQTVIPVGTSSISAGYAMRWEPSWSMTIPATTANTTSVTLTLHPVPTR